MKISEYLPEFRLLCSNGRSFTLPEFSRSNKLIFLFLTGNHDANSKSLAHLRQISSKYTLQDATFIIIHQFLNENFQESDTCNSSNFIHLIDYQHNIFTQHFVKANEPVVAIFNIDRQLCFQEELIVTGKSFTDLFGGGLNEEIKKIRYEFASNAMKNGHVVDQTLTDYNYGLSINVINLNDQEFFKNHVFKEGKVLLYFWSTNWDVSRFELSDLSFTTQVLKSMGIKLIPVNVDGKRYLKKVWLTLYANSCYGQYYVSELPLKDSKFKAFNNIITNKESTNYVLFSKHGEVLFTEKNMVSLVEMRKSLIAASKRKPDNLSKR